MSVQYGTGCNYIIIDIVIIYDNIMTELPATGEASRTGCLGS